MTLLENESLRQIGPTRSSKMRLPALGARGSMRSAGRSRSEESTANKVASKVMPTLKAKADSAMGISTGEELMGSA